MAFELIFGKSAVPGSWAVCERLLSLNTPDDIDVLRRKIRSEVYDEIVSKADQQKIRQLEGERDSAISSRNWDRAYDLCFEIANLAKTFTKENLEKAISSKKTFQESRGSGLEFVLAYIFYIHYDYQSDKLTNFDLYFGIRQFRYGMAIGLKVYAPDFDISQLEARLKKFLEISESTSLMERLVRTVDLSAFISSISKSHPKCIARQFLSLVDQIGLNPTLVEMFQSPIDLPSMPLLERYLLSALVDIFDNIQPYDGVAQRLWKKKWFVKFVTNYANIFQSYGALSFLMAIGEGWNFNGRLRFLAWPPFTEPSSVDSPFEFDNSVLWLCNASVMPVIFDKKTINPSSTLFHFPYMILGSKLEEFADPENLPKMMDLCSFFTVANVVEWRQTVFFNETHGEITTLKRAYTSIELLQHIMTVPVAMMTKMLDLNVFGHLSVFCHFFWHLKFHAENAGALTGPKAIDNFEAASVSLSLITKSAASPRDMGQLVGSVKKLREMVFATAAKGLASGSREITQFMVYLLGVFCSAIPNVFLRELLFSRENYGLQRTIFTWELAQRQHGPHLIGCMLRGADTGLRRRWAGEYQSQLCYIASSYFLFFFKSDFGIEEGINILLAIHGTYRPTPIASLIPILNEVDTVTKRGLAVKLFISKLLPGKPHYFLKGRSEFREDKVEGLKSVGVLVAGIVLASLVTELKGTALLGNFLPKEKQSRRALIREMKRCLELFST